MNRKLLGLSLAAGAIGLLMTDRKANKRPGTTKDMATILPADEDPAIGASGESFAHSLPENPGPQREAKILSAVISGDAMIRWSFVSSSSKGRSCTIPVIARAISIGPPGDSWRIICNYATAQHIANELECYLLTPKVANLIFLQSDKQLAPMNRTLWVQDGSMAKTSRSIEQSKALDQLVPADDAGLVANEGKHWVNGQRLYQNTLGSANWNAPEGVLGSRHNGPNYGWNQKGSGKPLQGFGLAHDMSHSDYSQMLVFMSRTVVVDGVDIDAAEVLKDPHISDLLSDEGPLPSAIHPDLIGIGA